MKTKVLTLTLLAGCAMAISAPLVKQEATVAIPRDFTGQRLPRFKNGLVLVYDFNLAKVWAYDRTGKTLLSLSLSVPNTVRMHITDIAAAPDGTVAVSASAFDGDGNGAPVIFWISPAGAVTRIVRLAPFSASRVVFANDGSLWAAGRIYRQEGVRFETAPEYDVLRHYDSQGRLLGSVVPNTTFASAPQNPALYSFLIGGQNRIGFLSLDAKEYVEVSLSGKMLGDWKIHTSLPFHVGDVMGAALTASGSVFLSLPPHPDLNTPYQGPPLYKLDKASGALQPADLSVDTPVTKPSVLIGGDGDKLVFYSKPPASVSWFAVQ